MRSAIVQWTGALSLAWVTVGCEVPRAADPKQVDEAWRARVETAHAYAARKAAAQPAAPATPHTASPGATPQTLLAPDPSPVEPPHTATTTKKKRARPKRAKDGALPPGRMALDVIRTPDGRGPKLIEISRTEQAPKRRAR